ncbi:TonB-dependent receptor [uncultured Zhongshania sp.]|uniref:TonB-dependent receptor plug domain-containing protein n=1 Tax=uncultured Zhongshania sp. TaxID=1642288 RepID=UPI0030D94D6F|tara:strand:- start:40577 stop:42565 length:1989 start_codon:yes stop_codon:yes gene_type:complete
MSEHKALLSSSKLFWAVATTIIASSNQVIAAAALPDDLTGLSLDALMDISVTTVSKKAERLSEAAAAVYVLTAEDIRQSGARNIPDALRLVPGVQVSQVDAHTWAVSARGFNSTVSDKLEVLMDGRSLYTPLFSGVYWDAQNTLLEDIDRIEVVRGPGGALWGANAVNGVINIITKPAAETQGSYVEMGGGTERRFVGMRFGGQLGTTGHFRAYAMGYDRDNQALAENSDPALRSSLGSRDQARDSADMAKIGFRSDWAPSEVNAFTVQGDYYDGSDLDNLNVGGTTMPVETTFSGWNMLGRWNRKLSSGGNFSLQIYLDQSQRDTPLSLDEQRETWDIDFSHSFANDFLSLRHNIVWGGNIRRSDDETVGTTVGFIPPDRSLETTGIFLQDTIGFHKDSLKLTVGTKLEKNDFTGTEVQPSARLAWIIDEDRTLWGSISRAVRIPNRFDAELGLGGFPLGNPNLKAEEVVAYEMGYRWRVRENLSIDSALFYNDYDNLRSLEKPPTPPFFAFANKQQGVSQGVEVSAQWLVKSNWNLKAGYSYLNINLDKDADSTDDGTIPPAEGLDPEHQFFLVSNWEINSSLAFNSVIRYVDDLPNALGNSQKVPAYTELDLRLAWQPYQDLELSLVGRNLIEDSHREANSWTASEIERGVYAQINWHY